MKENMNVDDRVWDKASELFDAIFETAVYRVDDEIKLNLNDVPKKVSDEWWRELYGYDVKKWKPTVDDRAFPNTHYSDCLIDVLEFRCYEVRSHMMKYIEEHKEELIKAHMCASIDAQNEEMNNNVIFMNVDENNKIHNEEGNN